MDFFERDLSCIFYAYINKRKARPVKHFILH